MPGWYIQQGGIPGWCTYEQCLLGCVGRSINDAQSAVLYVGGALTTRRVLSVCRRGSQRRTECCLLYVHARNDAQSAACCIHAGRSVCFEAPSSRCHLSGYAERRWRGLPVHSFPALMHLYTVLSRLLASYFLDTLGLTQHRLAPTWTTEARWCEGTELWAQDWEKSLGWKTLRRVFFL